MKLEWNEEKNLLLKQTRGLSFEMVEEAILDGRVVVKTHPNPKYAHQLMMYVEIDDYIYCVPFIDKGKIFFLKTIYPSRKANKLKQDGKL